MSRRKSHAKGAVFSQGAPKTKAYFRILANPRAAGNRAERRAFRRMICQPCKDGRHKNCTDSECPCQHKTEIDETETGDE